jgi:glycosyltransferase involved in cell wall biosynthesis
VKITQVSTRCWPYTAGLEESLYSLSTEFALAGNDVTWLATNSSGEFSIPQFRLGKFPTNRKQNPFPSGTFQLNPNFRIQRLNAYLRIGPYHITNPIGFCSEKKSDVFHIHSIVDFPLWIATMKKMTTSKLFVTIHDVSPTVATSLEAIFWNPYSHLLIPKLLKKFERIIVLSLVQFEFLKEIGVDLNKVSVVPLCFDTQVRNVAEDLRINRDNTIAKYGINANDFLIISVGRIISIKRYDLVIRALSKIPKTITHNVKYLIVGADEGHLSQLKQLVKELNLTKIIIFVGQKSHTETLGLLKSADLFVLPSEVEAFNLTTIEAMRLSVPVLISTGAGVRYLIRHNENGLLFERNNLMDLTKVLHELLKDRSQLIRLSFKGKETAETSCSPEAVAKKHLEIYGKSS